MSSPSESDVESSQHANGNPIRQQGLDYSIGSALAHHKTCEAVNSNVCFQEIANPFSMAEIGSALLADGFGAGNGLAAFS